MGPIILRPGAPRLIVPGVRVFQPSAAFTGVLDGISNVSAAYSLRKLRTAYTGYACKVRRSSNGDEQDIGFASDGEFNSAAFSSFVGGGTGYVVTLYDQSGNGRNATQATTARCYYVSLSPKPQLVSTGGTIEMQVAVAIDMALILICANLLSVVAYQAVIGTTDGHILLRNASLTELYYSVPSIFSAANTRVNGVATKVFTENANNIFSFFGTSVSKIFTIGHDSNGGQYGNNSISEIFVLNSTSTADHNAIGNNMATRYGLSWTTV